MKRFRIQPAISLHSVDDELRSELFLPMNKAYNIASIIEAVKAFLLIQEKSYVWISSNKDKNDSIEAARKLVTLLNGIQAKVNLLYFNPYPGTTGSTSFEEDMLIQRFFYQKVWLYNQRVKRFDISAACGQLKKKANGNSWNIFINFYSNCSYCFGCRILYTKKKREK